MNREKPRLAVAVVMVAALGISSTASAFWNPKDWDMKDGWGKGGNHPLAPMGWGNKDKRGPFGGENGWGAIDSMMDNMGMGDAMSDLNTDVEWDLNLDTQLKGKASGEGRGRSEGKNRSKTRARSELRSEAERYYPYPGGAPYYPYYNAGPAAPAAPYGYPAYPYPPQMMGPQMMGPAMMGPMGGAVPFAPAMPPAAPSPYYRR